VVKVKRKLFLFLLALWTLVLTACSANITTNKTVMTEEKIYDQLFDMNNFISIKIHISEKELEKIQKDYDKYREKGSKSPIYRKADKVTITIGDQVYEIEDVGVRMKGNTSRTDFYSKEEGVYNIINLKLSFNETFDEVAYYGEDTVIWPSDDERKERKKRTFATLKGLDIKYNKSYDTTYLRENYSFEIFREAGVLAAKQTLAVLYVGEKSWGVCNIYEPVDDIFLERYLPKEDLGGDLYKAAWTNNPAAYTLAVTYGINNPDKGISYNYDLKTNKKKSKHESFSNLLSVLNSKNPSKESFDSVVDVDYWLKFAAASYFTGNPDDMRNNYNNHFVYFLKSTGKAIFIPYDYNIAFGAVSSWDPTGTAMTNISPYSTKAAGRGGAQMNPLFIQSNKYYKDEYTTALEEIASSDLMKFESFKKKHDIVSSLYKDYVMPDIDFRNLDESRLKFSLESNYRKTGNMSVEEYMEKILDTYERAVSDYRN